MCSCVRDIKEILSHLSSSPESDDIQKGYYLWIVNQKLNQGCDVEFMTPLQVAFEVHLAKAPAKIRKAIDLATRLDISIDKNKLSLLVDNL